MADSEIELFFDSNLFPSRPVENRMITIEISGLVALDGSVFEGSVESLYLTRFDPFYSNAMSVRLIAGQFLNEVEDSVIDQFIWFFSNEADFKNYRPCVAAADAARYRSYKSRWVAAWTVVTLLSGTSINARMQKRLGDLSVLRDGAAKDLLQNMRKELEDLTRLLEDGGDYGRNMVTGVKSELNPDMPIVGRMWAEDELYGPFDAPAANTWGIFSKGGSYESTKKKFYRGR